jgi:hypothetical protein
MVCVASHCAKWNPAAPSLGCRGPIRFGSNSKIPFARLHQSQMAWGNNGGQTSMKFGDVSPR